ncbi:hypothetical protein [Ktedonobacter racemifer]|uniref:hypothetical protein n=1 Tax=Ktedonobacter racemifer TaxID=363277 RepID=UPI001FCB0C9E|nr:hypothetical protein [Ktedonobacter racemifer]
MVASATGPLGENLMTRAVSRTVLRTHRRPLCWFSDGWHGYAAILHRAYRQPQSRQGKTGRRKLVVPDTVSLTQTVKHRDEHGRLLSVAIRMARWEQARDPPGPCTWSDFMERCVIG